MNDYSHLSRSIISLGLRVIFEPSFASEYITINFSKMTKILVPTDFSANSKAGIRFAMQLSTQREIELLFIHVFHVTKLAQWTDEDFEIYSDKKRIQFTTRLNRFVTHLYKSLNIKSGKYSCIVVQGISADISIMDYCRDHEDIDYICIGTRGASKLNKLFGTNTGNLITRSEVPVIAVPAKYRRSAVTELLYATDFSNYSEELKAVVDFARPINAKIKVLHLASENEVFPDKKTIEKTVNGEYYNGIELQVKRAGETSSLEKDLKREISGSKPSMVVMFTDQNRGFFRKMFTPSKAEQLSFATSVPLLAIHK
jgi:nucleotide-binding universal stress UspA family protein